MSPDTVSPNYPHRPMRPLPKRRLRERLSSDAAESITYPPAPPTTTPLFHYPYSLGGDEDRSRDGRFPVDRPRADEIEHNYIARRNVPDADSEEEYVEVPDRNRHSRHSPDPSGRSYRYVQKPESSKYAKPEPPPSITSSADGYDSFENTNNKKKRKIPTPGDPGMNGIHLSKEMASLGISSPLEELPGRGDLRNGSGEAGNEVGQHFGTASPTPNGTTPGFSGPGRGRYGRVRNGRSPLRTLSDAPNNWTNGRSSKPRQPQWSTNESAGIISTAMANAEKLPLTPSRGQENISLLQEHASKKSSPATAQFTFTCDSQVPGTVAWPGPPSIVSPAMNQSPAAARSMATHGTQTVQKLQAPGHLPQDGPPSKQAPSSKQNPNQTASPKKSRRRLGREYIIAARERRAAQEYQTYHHPPAPEDEWICEFCEYERIFGRPPEALIRQYEIKDRRLRNQEAERRRLLEKAKMKGRKGKKGSKMAPKNTAPAQDRPAQNQQAVPQSSLNNSRSQSQGTQSEEYYEDEYDEDYAQDEIPPSPSVPDIPDRLGEQHSSARQFSFRGAANGS